MLLLRRPLQSRLSVRKISPRTNPTTRIATLLTSTSSPHHSKLAAHRPRSVPRYFTATMATTTPRKELPPWSAPPSSETGASLPHLTIYNTFTRKKEKFIPLDKYGKKVTWYCCGPTVYDAAHLGHARNYVTTDVLRRIMRDYFGFEVQFVQNVTDVDDKIILRARQKYLLDEYAAKNPTVNPEVLETATKAFDAYFSKNVAEGAEGTVATFETWAKQAHPALMELLKKEAAKKYGAEEEKEEDEVALDEKTTKIKMHLNTLQTAARAIVSPPASAEEFYSATTSVLLPYLDAANKGRDYGPEVFSKLSSYWERHFNEDMATLNVLPPTTTTRVSEFIPQNVSFVEKLVNKGFAYPTADGSVYFDIAAYEAAGHHYAKLQPWNRGDDDLLADGEGALTSESASTLPNTVEKTDWPAEKKNKQDFALWKASKPGEPSWESPWGYGRPGWHIECSVMCSEVLGGEIDIHSGGVDLAFPHHDNEIAQSEAYWDGCSSRSTADGKHQWVNYFMHMGHLQIHGSKMSKSLKNFVSVRDALQRGGWTARGLRIVFLLGGWKDGIEVREGVLAEAKNWETVVNKFFTNVSARISEEDASEAAGNVTPQPWGKLEASLQKELDAARVALDKALCDSFNTPGAMQAILDIIGQTNIYMSSTTSLALVKDVARWVTRIVTIFGLDTANASDRIGWTTVATNSDSLEASLPYLRLFSSFRDRVRSLAVTDTSAAISQELLTLSDKIRDIELPDLGVSLDDRESKNGKPALIKFVPAEELRAMREDKERKAAEKEAIKLERQKAEEQRLKRAMIDPKVMFKEDGEGWTEFDSDGIPTRDKEGAEVVKSKRKNLVKQHKAQRKAWENATGNKYVEEN